MLIKICGMKEPGNVKEVAALHPDMLGFIFYKASPRYAGDLSPRALERLPAAIGKVGVFVNAETGFIENIVRRYKMDTIQLHALSIFLLVAIAYLNGRLGYIKTWFQKDIRQTWPKKRVTNISFWAAFIVCFLFSIMMEITSSFL